MLMENADVEAELKSAIMKVCILCVLMNGLKMMLLLPVEDVATDSLITVCTLGRTATKKSIFSLVGNYFLFTIPTGAVAVTNNEFGVSEESAIHQTPMCHGNESSLFDCPGFHSINITGDQCQIGNYQAGVWCIEGTKHTIIMHALWNSFCVSVCCCSNGCIRVLVDALCRDGTGQISCDPGTKRLLNQ